MMNSATPTPPNAPSSYSSPPKKPSLWASLTDNYDQAFRFSGRMSRREFWYFILAISLFGIPLMLMTLIVSIVLGIFGLILMSLLHIWGTIAVAAAATRRLHDVGRSGWPVVVAYGLFMAAIITGILFGEPNGSGQYTMEGPAAAIVAFAALACNLMIWFNVFFLFRKGTEGPNKYGA